MPKRLKILAVVASANPNKGSEPGLGWKWIESLTRHCDLWVITGEREGNREAIQQRLDDDPVLSERLNVFFIPRPDGPAYERTLMFLYYRRYRKWHEKAFSLAQELAGQIDFDLAHQVNMTGFREPGFLWKLDLPFVWGPVGGTANVPLRFASVLGLRELPYNAAKVAVNSLQLRYHPRVRAALNRANGFVTATSGTRARFLEVYAKDGVVISDTGPPDENPICDVPDTAARPDEDRREVTRLVWSGLHISRKALPLVLDALALLPADCRWHLDIIGDGPMKSRWQSRAKRIGVDGHCTWHGWVDKAMAHTVMKRADIFVFPSLHEGAPTVAMEALAFGLPVISLDHCGMADSVDSTCGIKIEVSNPRKVSKEIAAAVERLCRDADELNRLSAGARLRAKQFEWDGKAQRMLKVYSDAVDNWNSSKRANDK